MSSGGPPATALCGVTRALAGLRLAVQDKSRLVVPAIALTGLLGRWRSARTTSVSTMTRPTLADVVTTEWNPVFRVDSPRSSRHDNSSIKMGWPDRSRVGRGDRPVDDFEFGEDPRSLAVRHARPVTGERADHRRRRWPRGTRCRLPTRPDRIDAVELNPAIHELVTGEYADFGGRFFDQPGVNYVNADGRAYLARSDDSYDLVWYPAPDSYAASNVATSGAFVLSESYLYTTEAITATLDHLAPDGILAAQFGELNFDERPNRTTRYVGTVRDALEAAGVDAPGNHVLVASTADANFPTLRYSTVLVKQTPFTAGKRFCASPSPRQRSLALGSSTCLARRWRTR